jgi:hypothetical protein
MDLMIRKVADRYVAEALVAGKKWVNDEPLDRATLTRLLAERGFHAIDIHDEFNAADRSATRKARKTDERPA